jgi:hypothetical protein
MPSSFTTGGRLTATGYLHTALTVAAVLLSAVLCVPFDASAQTTLAPVPAGTTSETNPEIQVIAPGRVAYRYSLNGSPYSE